MTEQPESPAQDVAEIQNVGNTGPISDDIRWAVNVLLEKIAAKFEANDTLDIWRSDAAATVRSFKHDLSASQPPAGPTQGVAAGRSAMTRDEAGDLVFELVAATRDWLSRSGDKYYAKQYEEARDAVIVALTKSAPDFDAPQERIASLSEGGK